MAKKKLPMAKASIVDSCAPSTYKMTKEQIERERRYKAEDGLRTLQRADEIRNDKRVMDDIKSLAKEQMATAKKFAK